MGGVRNRTAVVTGGASGIGKGITTLLSQEGANVVVLDVNDDAANEVASDLQEAGGRTAAFVADLTESTQVEDAFDYVDEQFGGVDILVNNAGIIEDDIDFTLMTEESWDRVMTVNAKSQFLCSRRAARSMVSRGRGRIINIASRSWLGNIGIANYSASKGAVVSLTRSLAIELGRHGITANCISPTLIVTPLFENMPAEVQAADLERAKKQPIPRMGKAVDVARVVLFFGVGRGRFHHRPTHLRGWRDRSLVFVTMNSSSAVIDFRVQPPFKSFLGIHFYEVRKDQTDPDNRLPFGHDRIVTPAMTGESFHAFLDEMEEAGVGHAVIVGQRAGSRWGLVSNEDISELVREHPGRFTGFGGVDPTQSDAVEQLAHLTGPLGLKGVALIPGWNDEPLADDDPLIFPLYEACQETKTPVIVTASHYIGADLEYSNPVHLQHVLEAFPDLTLIIGHGSWPWTMGAVALAMRYPNVYLMPEFYMYTPGMPGAQDYVDAANTFLTDRLLYSSCFPSRSLPEALTLFRRLPLTEEASAKAQYSNAAKLLGHE